MAKTQKHPSITLRHLVLALVSFTGLATLTNSFYSGYRVGSQALVNNALKSEYMYSTRIAAAVDEFIIEAQTRLKYSAATLSKSLDQEDSRVTEARRLLEQDRVFDRVVVVSADGHIRVNLSEIGNGDSLEKSYTLNDPALGVHEPIVSNAHTHAVGGLNTFVSVPIFDPEGLYLGYIGGTLRLQRDSPFSNLIRNNFYDIGAKVYVFDTQKRLIFHPDGKRLGSSVSNPAVEEIFNDRSGSIRTIDSQGQDVIAGFSPIRLANWGVVTQQPTATVLAPLQKLSMETLLTTLPLATAGLALMWFLISLITRPLRQLADNTATGELSKIAESISTINAWYFEASSIKQALLRRMRSTTARISDLQKASQTDVLTGLFNRRAMENFLAKFEETHQSIALISLDIDHFKKVNDTFGHDVGDKVLQRLGELMRECSREGDLPCRMGGEEFMLLLPNTRLVAAVEVGERLRQAVESTKMEPVGHITISLGVTTWQWDRKLMIDSLKEVDELMYRAKREGRNRLCAALGD